MKSEREQEEQEVVRDTMQEECLLLRSQMTNPCSHQVYQAMGFWERDWSRPHLKQKAKNNPKMVLIVHWKTDYHLGKICILPAAERLHIESE